MTDRERVFELTCALQTYAWGKIGRDSAAYQLANNSKQHKQLDETKPYSELWMGTHPNGPSLISSSQQQLSEYLGEQLPFLFKVLSVQKPLSIQAHPNKELAGLLHTDRPHIYKDPNHKPELCCALTPFEALCQFRPIQQIAQHLETYPEFGDLFVVETKQNFICCANQTNNNNNTTEQKAKLRSLFDELMKIDEKTIEQQVNKLTTRLKQQQQQQQQQQQTDTDLLLLRVNNDFPGDVGVFCVLLLNYVQLQQGDALFLGPNEPHAYLSGDCMECMACSDNVVRAGLTVKLKDAPTLVDMLTYNMCLPTVLKGEVVDSFTRCYRPPVDEFVLLHTVVEAGQSYKWTADNSHAIWITINGCGSIQTNPTTTKETSLSIVSGTVVFIQRDTEVVMVATERLELYGCLANTQSSKL